MWEAVAAHHRVLGLVMDWDKPEPVSRAKSSPVPGVVAYFRHGYAAGQK